MEIFQNTIWKLVFRQGSDNDRRYIIPSLGEPVFTTDTYRLYVGNGFLSGGVVAGNVFQGSTNASPITYTSSVIGDLAYDTDKDTLYRLKYTTANQLSSWEPIGGIYSSNDSYIKIENNKISLNALSSYSLSEDLVEGPVILDSGKITLSANIPFKSVSTKTITVSSGLLGFVDGVDVFDKPINPLSSNLVIQSNQLFAKYSGLSGTGLNYSRGITSVTKLSAGDYIFYFPKQYKVHYLLFQYCL